jgi:hypothetical protein
MCNFNTEDFTESQASLVTPMSPRSIRISLLLGVKFLYCPIMTYKLCGPGVECFVMLDVLICIDSIAVCYITNPGRSESYSYIYKTPNVSLHK